MYLVVKSTLTLKRVEAQQANDITRGRERERAATIELNILPTQLS